MTRARGSVVLACGLLVALSVSGCAVPFLHFGSGGVKAPRAAKAAKDPAEKKLAKAAKQKNKQLKPSRKAGASDAPGDAVAAVVEPEDAAKWFRRAQRQVERDSIEAAVGSLQTALQLDAGYSPALALYSKLDFDAGRHADAIERLAILRSQPARFSDEELSLLLTGLALHQDALGQAREAHATLESAPRGQDKRTGSARAYVLLRSDAPDEATDVARRALDQDSKSAVNLNNRGITQLRAGDPEAARRTFLEAIERDAKLAGPYYNLAILEKFYALDDDAAARWYAAYRERSQADPDGLAEVFRAAERKPVAEGSAAR